MTELFKKIFIKNYKDIDNPEVRSRYGKSAGILGIIANVFLFAIKLFAGIITGSISIIADAINNLTDFITSIITLVGFKLSNAPADKEHPFGHARIEYITALIVSIFILTIGIEVGRTGVDKIINGSDANFTTTACIILGISILTKLFLSIIFKGLGKSINSEALFAMSQDSRNDTFSTSLILVSAILSIKFNLYIDGYLSVAIAILIIISAISLIKSTISPLLGEPPKKKFIKEIEQKILAYDGIMGIHDLVVHNYGPLKTFASVHIEVDAKVDVMISHELSDNIERDFNKNLNIFLVCHLDPIVTDDEETNMLKKHITNTLTSFDERLNLHDFRLVHGVNHSNIIFDVVIPYETKYDENSIKYLVDEELKKFDKKYFAVIEFDKSFCE